MAHILDSISSTLQHVDYVFALAIQLVSDLEFVVGVLSFYFLAADDLAASCTVFCASCTTYGLWFCVFTSAWTKMSRRFLGLLYVTIGFYSFTRSWPCSSILSRSKLDASSLVQFGKGGLNVSISGIGFCLAGLVFDS